MELEKPPLNEIVDQYKPLKDRVFDLVRDETVFNFKTVKSLFPTESDKNLYRAIAELENSKRIRFLTYKDRSKLYTAVGSSDLPMLIGGDGASFPCSEVLKGIEYQYDSNGNWLRLKEINELPITISSLFAVAQTEDPKQLREGWKILQQKLLLQQRTLKQIEGYIDSILRHPSMNGDMDRFKAVFAGEDEAMPKPPEITKFKAWLNKWRQRNES